MEDLIYFKLVNGLEVVGKVLGEEEGTILVENPLTVLYRWNPIAGMPTIAMQRYMAFGKEPLIVFQKDDIMNWMEPSDGMNNYYTYCLSQIEQTFDKNIANDFALLNKQETDDQRDTNADEQVKELLKRMMDPGANNTLH